MNAPALVLFRDDLRLSDNPALAAAVASGAPVACLYVYDDATPGLRPLGGASRWWLNGSLVALGDALTAAGGELATVRGAQEAVVSEVAAAIGARAVFWNRRYGLAERDADAALKTRLTASGLTAQSFDANLMHEPWSLVTDNGGYRVYSPFWRAFQRLGEPEPPLAAPKSFAPFRWPDPIPRHAPLETLALEPTKPDWAGGLRETWPRGEAAGQDALRLFLAGPIAGYAEDRNRPEVRASSRLSPHLRFGEVSTRQAWHAAKTAQSQKAPGSDRDYDTFYKELGWREFSYHLLFHNPELATVNFQRKFDPFAYLKDEPGLEAWRRGMTGYPIVDAGMRELWRIGWMHNRVRMITASFLIKHLLTDWRRGEEWFWDTLVDADPANNAASWQWVAGTGADPAPYFRVFNPVLQGEKFDASGGYVRRWVPELARLPDRFLHKPWIAPPEVLKAAGVTLGRDYPAPVVAHDRARARALAAYDEMRAR